MRDGSSKNRNERAWRENLGKVLRQRILDRIRDTSLQDTKVESTNDIIDANNCRDDSLFREQKKQAFMNQAMQYMDNPIFKKQVLQDLESQEKYFEHEPPAVPSDWLKEGQAFNQESAKNTSTFAVDRLQDVPPKLVKRIREENDMIKNAHDAPREPLFRTVYGEEHLFDIGDEHTDFSWNSRNKKILKNLLQEFSSQKVAVFRPAGNLEVFYLNFCDMNLSYVQLEPCDEGQGQSEFYNAYEIYLDNGIFPEIEMDSKILAFKNKEGVANITGNHLLQTKIESEDCLLLKYGDFERILIFNRETEPVMVPDKEYGGMKKQVINTEKYLFQQTLNLAMLICSYADGDRRGQIAIYEKVQRPSYADLTQIIAMEEAKKAKEKAKQRTGKSHIDFVVENMHSYAERPAQYDKLPFNDDMFNSKLRLWPGRKALFITMLIDLFDPRKFKTTTVPFTFQCFMLEKECYEREDPSYFLVRQGKFKKLAGNAEQRSVYYSQIPETGLRFTLAIKEFIASVAHQQRAIVSPLCQAQMRHYLCEIVLKDALTYEHLLYERILVNYHTVKMRRGAGRCFEQWLPKRISALKDELTALQAVQDKPLLVERKLKKSLIKAHTMDIGQDPLAVFGIDNKMKREQSEMKQSDPQAIEHSLNINYELAKFRNHDKIRRIESQLRAMEPLADLWHIDNPDGIEDLKLHGKYESRGSRGGSSERMSSLHGSQYQGGSAMDAAKRQGNNPRQEGAGGAGRDDKAFEAAYNKVISYKIEQEEAKVKNYGQFVKDRLAPMHSKEVNPIVETFDLLHLQEVSLRNRLLDRPKILKNSRPMHAPINRTRKGGQQKRKDRKFLDKVLKFGVAGSALAHFSDKKSRASRKSKASDIETITVGGGSNGKSNQAKLVDPLRKLQRRYFSPQYIVRQRDSISIAMNLVEFEAQKKRAKQFKRSQTLAMRRGSEAHWNPESKRRVKAVRSALMELRGRRKAANRQVEMEGDHDELSKTLNKVKTRGTPSQMDLKNKRKLEQAKQDLSQVLETFDGENSTRLGNDLLSRHKFDLDSDAGGKVKPQFQSKHVLQSKKENNLQVTTEPSEQRDSYIVMGDDRELKKETITLVDYGPEASSSDEDEKKNSAWYSASSKKNLKAGKQHSRHSSGTSKQAHSQKQEAGAAVTSFQQLDKTLGSREKQLAQIDEAFQLDMKNLGLQTINKTLEMTQREWINASNRHERSFGEKKANGAPMGNDDPWKIRTYAPSIKKRQAVQGIDAENEANGKAKKLFLPSKDRNRVSILNDPILLEPSAQRKSLTIEEIGEIQMLERESRFTDTDRTCSTRTCNSIGTNCSIQ